MAVFIIRRHRRKREERSLGEMGYDMGLKCVVGHRPFIWSCGKFIEDHKTMLLERERKRPIQRKTSRNLVNFLFLFIVKTGFRTTFFGCCSLVGPDISADKSIFAQIHFRSSYTYIRILLSLEKYIWKSCCIIQMTEWNFI